VCHLAERNRQFHQLDNVTVLQSHWLDSVMNQPVDMIVSNPPYIDRHDPHLSEGDVRFEPRSALVAEDNGLSDICTIARQAPQFLTEGGWLLLEHGYEQASEVRDILQAHQFVSCCSNRDMAGHERVTMGQFFGKQL